MFVSNDYTKNPLRARITYLWSPSCLIQCCRLQQCLYIDFLRWISCFLERDLRKNETVIFPIYHYKIQIRTLVYGKGNKIFSRFLETKLMCVFLWKAEFTIHMTYRGNTIVHLLFFLVHPASSLSLSFFFSFCGGIERMALHSIWFIFILISWSGNC